LLPEENRRTILFIEHDLTPYKDDQEMTEYTSEALREASK
jgi:hypothetical protein